MGITNLLFISKITPHHIPVLPPFMARPHLPVRAGWKHVSTIFDLDRWARSIDKHMVEWKDVKDTRGLKDRRATDQAQMADEEDQMGCWSVWAEHSKEGKPYTASYLPDYLNLGKSILGCKKKFWAFIASWQIYRTLPSLMKHDCFRIYTETHMSHSMVYLCLLTHHPRTQTHSPLKRSDRFIRATKIKSFSLRTHISHATTLYTGWAQDIHTSGRCPTAVHGILLGNMQDGPTTFEHLHGRLFH
jgi:hypothetical protein